MIGCVYRIVPDKGADESKAGTKKARKTKKEPFVIQYDDDVDYSKLFSQSRAATTLTRATLERWSKLVTTLPDDLNYEPDKLFKLFLKPRVMVSHVITIANPG